MSWINSEKAVIGLCIFLLLIGFSRIACPGDNEIEGVPTVEEIEDLKQAWKDSEPKSKRHILVIFEAKMMPEDSKYKFEYHTDSQTIWSTAVYAVGDTISFTTRKLNRENSEIREENVKLKAEIAQRDKNWLSIKENIMKTLLDYN